VQSALDELRARLGEERIDFAELVILGARVKAHRLLGEVRETREARMRLAEMIRQGSGPAVDVAAADEVKRLGLIADDA
jgi:hypothetical protein